MLMEKPGKIDTPMSAVGFGTWGISGNWGGTNDKESIAAIHKAIDLGINLFDTAPVYGLGHSEEVLGKALKKKRGQVIIASKCGIIWDDHKQVKKDLTGESLRKEINQVLTRLQTDYVDIWQIHWPDPNTPIIETMNALMEIKNSGKIRYIGVSNFSLALTKEAMKYGEVVSHQGLYNMLEQNPNRYHSSDLTYRTRDEILPFVEEQGMAFFPYSPLMQGLLAGRFKTGQHFSKKDVRKNNPKLQGYLLITYLEIAEKLKTIAVGIGKPLSQLAINWLINQKTVSSVICGARNPRHIEDNAQAADWKLDENTLKEIDSLLASYSKIIHYTSIPIK
jgi:aryl-alcohol dehydrogenase-like predicted oxidoreductase